MAAKTTRLDRLLSKAMSIKKADVRQIAATGGILVDGVPCKDVSRVVNMFSTIAVDGKCYQDIRPRYIMLNKPAGYVSATVDKKHKTVFDLVQIDNPQNLHIAGRLDLNSTGLLLLTNDSRWSEALTAPNKNVAKVYRVELEHPIGPDYQEAFRKGMFFPYEGITTQPAKTKNYRRACCKGFSNRREIPPNKKDVWAISKSCDCIASNVSRWLTSR